MKKKILLGLGGIALITILSINVALVQNGNRAEENTITLGKVASAQAELPDGTYPGRGVLQIPYPYPYYCVCPYYWDIDCLCIF